eukprot:GHVS01026516.1.p1 GENE.GHVS01026516.1~~GHVS01026516.1.p1  ORF type:complete len:392 (+),score=106.16 GHVS01026516.1:152-1327(+)
MGNNVSLEATRQVPFGEEGEFVQVDLSSRLGDGGVGIVYPGNLQSDNRPVAVKIIHTTSADKRQCVHRAVAEFGSTRHRNLVGLLGCWSDASFTYVVEERCEGGDLQAHMCRHYSRQLPEESVARDLAEAVLKGLHCIHDKGWVHGDIKFENLMFAAETSEELADVKIIDLDSARPQIHPRDKSSSTLLLDSPPPVLDSPNITCTLQYAGPEVLDGIVTPATDVRAVGCLVYLMMEGRLPHLLSYTSSNDCLSKLDRRSRDKIRSKLIRPASFPRGMAGLYSPGCMDFMRGALESDVKSRFQNARECLLQPWLQQNQHQQHKQHKHQQQHKQQQQQQHGVDVYEDEEEVCCSTSSSSVSSPNLSSSSSSPLLGSALSSRAISFETQLFFAD